MRTRATLALVLQGPRHTHRSIPPLSPTLHSPHAFSSSFVMSAMSMMNQSAPE